MAEFCSKTATGNKPKDYSALVLFLNGAVTADLPTNVMLLVLNNFSFSM